MRRSRSGAAAAKAPSRGTSHFWAKFGEQLTVKDMVQVLRPHGFLSGPQAVQGCTGEVEIALPYLGQFDAARLPPRRV